MRKAATFSSRAAAVPRCCLGGPGNDTLRGGSGPTIMISGSGSQFPAGGRRRHGPRWRDDGLRQQLRGTPGPVEHLEFRRQLCRRHVGELLADSTYPLDADTVFSNDAVDSLVGGSGTDLFFQALGDNLRDLRSGESVIPIS